MVALAPVEINVTCGRCAKVYNFSLDPINCNAWFKGLENIQDCFPNMDANDRETLISWKSNQYRHTPILCGQCFDEIMGPED